jgi:hypothetical protein
MYLLFVITLLAGQPRVTQLGEYYSAQACHNAAVTLGLDLTKVKCVSNSSGLPE